jgi:hypothetical protein
MASGPRPGTMGLTPIAGEVGRLIRLGQKLNGNGFSTWEHAFILLPGDQILEAEPGGARIVPLHYDDVYWCQGICQAYLPTSTGRNAPSAPGTPASAPASTPDRTAA